MAYIGPIGSTVAFQGTVPWSVLGGNQSISGTVLVNNGSVVAFQGGAPWANTNVGSIITVQQGSIATVIIGGSIAANFTPPANQSVSGTVGASIIGLPPVNVTNFPLTQNVAGSVAAWLQSSNASVITVGTAAPNQSVSGTVQVDVRGSVATVIIGGSIAASFTPPANQSVSGTVQVQESGTWIVSVISANPSSMLVGASLIGLSPVSVSNFPATQNVNGSVIAFQGGTWSQSVVGQGAAGALTNGWPIVNGEANDATGTFTNATQTTSVTNNNLDGYGNTLISINGTYGTATAIFEGSDDGGTTWYTVSAARDDTNVIETGYTSLTNISRSWQINNSGFDSIRVRSTAVASGTANVRISSSAAPNSSGATVAIGVALPAGTAVLGSIATLQGTNPWTVVSSLAGGIFPVSGSVAAVVTNFPTTQNVSGSVVAFQGTSPWVIQSIVGTYTEDQASTNADKGLLAFGIRNDTVASLVGSDLDYGAWSQDSAGRHLVKPFAADEARFQFTGSVVSTSVTLIAASVIGKRQYMTDWFIANTGATTTRVTIQDGSTSVIAHTIAPSGGGSNAPGIAMPPRTAPSQDLTFQGITGTSVLYMTVNGYTAP